MSKSPRGVPLTRHWPGMGSNGHERRAGSVTRQWAVQSRRPCSSTDSTRKIWTQPPCAIHVVTAENRGLYERELDASFRLCHHVYVIEQGWEQFRSADQRVTDQYDNADAIYLLAIEDDSQKLVGAARLLPTVKGAVLSEFTDIMSGYVLPRCPHVFHLSRMLVVAERRESSRLNMVQAMILCAVQEYCLAEDIEQLTFLARMAQLPLYFELGWNPQPLGIPEVLCGVSCAVITVDISEHALRLTREAGGIAGSVLVRRGITLPAIRMPPVPDRLC